MWSVYLDTHPARATSTRLLGLASRRAFYSPLSMLRDGQIPSPSLPGARWVRVRTLLATVAPEDVDLIHLSPEALVARAFGRRRIYLGREMVGEIVEVGPEVEMLRVGDRVVYQYGPCCVTRDLEPPCRQCAAGNYALCEQRYGVRPFDVGAGWSEEMLVHEQQLFLVPDTLTNEQATLLMPTATALHAALRHAPEADGALLVLGSDAAGLLLVQTLRGLAPNATVAALPTFDYQIEYATRAGASHILHADEGLEAVARITGGRLARARGDHSALIGGFDIVYDTSGTSGNLARALHWVREGGAVVLAHRGSEQPGADLSALTRRALTLLGAGSPGTEAWPPRGEHPTWQGTRQGQITRVATMALAAALVLEGRLAPERYVTHRFPLREVRSAIEVAHQPEQHRALQILLDVGSRPQERRVGKPTVRLGIDSAPQG